MTAWTLIVAYCAGWNVLRGVRNSSGPSHWGPAGVYVGTVQIVLGVGILVVLAGQLVIS